MLRVISQATAAKALHCQPRAPCQLPAWPQSPVPVVAQPQSPLPAPSTERRKESVCTSGLTVCFLVILQRIQVSSMWPRADVMNTMKAFSWIAGLTNNRFPVQSKPGAPRERGAGFGRALCSAGSPSIPLMLGLQWGPCRRQVQHGSITCLWCLRAPWKGIQVPGRLIPKCQEGVYVLWDHCFTQGPLGAAQHHHCCSRDGETEAWGGEGGCAELANSKSRKVHLLAPVLPTCPLAPSAASSPALRLLRVYLD